MDNKKILSSKITFIKNYLGGVKGSSCLSLPFDWFYVSMPLSDKDIYCQSFRIVDLFKEYKDYIIKELKEVNISVEVSRKMYIFKMC